jgi:hypothetical protein
MSQTMSVGRDRENFEFLNELTKERSDLSKAVRAWLHAVEPYSRWNATKRGRHLSAGLSLPKSPWER